MYNPKVRELISKEPQISVSYKQNWRSDRWRYDEAASLHEANLNANMMASRLIVEALCKRGQWEPKPAYDGLVYQQTLYSHTYEELFVLLEKAYTLGRLDNVQLVMKPYG